MEVGVWGGGVEGGGVALVWGGGGGGGSGRTGGEGNIQRFAGTDREGNPRTSMHDVASRRGEISADEGTRVWVHEMETEALACGKVQNHRERGNFEKLKNRTKEKDAKCRS